MPSFRSAKVVEMLMERQGLQRVQVVFTDDAPAVSARAYVLTELTGEVQVGDEVVCNTTAVDLGLGTGGWHIVHWVRGRRAWHAPGPGHIMKLRYTSLQRDTGSAEEQQPELAESLTGMPVAVCTVHSQVAAVSAAFAARRPDARLVYVMTDGAALPLALSDLVVALRERSLLAATVTAGHAFGGDHEAVSVPSALLVARHLCDADAVVVGMGPGVVGTGTAYGTTAVEAGGALAATAGLDGLAVLALRASSGDPRERHRGLSHHVRAVLATSFAPCELAVVDTMPVEDQAKLAQWARPEHTQVAIAAPPIADMFSSHDLHVTTMGRDVHEDLLFFQSAAAAGERLATLLAP